MENAQWKIESHKNVRKKNEELPKRNRKYSANICFITYNNILKAIE